MKVVVASSDDPHQQVPGTSDGVDLEDLGDRAQVSDDPIVRALRDGQGGEGQNAEAGRSRIDVGAVPDDDLSALRAGATG